MLRRYTKVLVKRPGATAPERFLGKIPALPGCIVVGPSRDEVLEELERRGAERLEALVRSGLPLPDPDLPTGFEGLVVDHSET